MINDEKHITFYHLFYKRERKVLQGNKSQNFWVIFSILFITFLAIGFANGSLEYLAKKMKDPFVNWVNIKVPGFKIDKIYQIKEQLNDTLIKKRYAIATVTGYNKSVMTLQDVKQNETYAVRYRTVELNDPILNSILSPRFLIRGHGFDKEKDETLADLGIIVKEELLERLHYDDNTPFVYMPFKLSDTSSVRRLIPIPVLAVVKNLPGMADFVTTQYFYAMRNFPYQGNIFNPSGEKNLNIYLLSDSVTVFKVMDSMAEFLQRESGVEVMAVANKYTDSYRNGFVITFDFYPKPLNIYQIDNYYKRLKESGILNKSGNYLRIYDFKSRKYRNNDVGKYDNISVNFNYLDHIQEFSEYLSKAYQIEIDVAQIKAKENYNFVTRLTRIISFILIAFSILSVCMFVSNLLKKHLEKIKNNLGTLKAFGLSNNTLQAIYTKMILRFIGGAVIMAFVTAWIVGKLGALRILLLMFGNKLETGESYFKLFDTWTFVAIFLILSISYVVIFYVARNILKKTPGDLIYNR